MLLTHTKHEISTVSESLETESELHHSIPVTVQ